MSKVGQVERATQNRIVKLFQKQLGYEYLGNWEERANRNIEEALLRLVLQRRGYSDSLITKTLTELDRIAGDQSQSLYDVNKTVYGLLRYGVKIKPEVGENTETVWLIDWDEPENNHFAIAEEVSIDGENRKRPDIVLYINGIAVGVLELKRSTVSVAEGIRQNLGNQTKTFIRPFFSTMQLVMAGNDTEGLRYGTIETSEKYYLSWKEEDPDFNPNTDHKEDKYLPADETVINGQSIRGLLDVPLVRLCNKKRLLELIHDFVVYDAGVKKLCRHNQYFGVKAAQRKLKAREGGILWHTQGSGKSLTMVWLAKWLRENVTDSRVLIVTDRVELDEQIEKVFMGVGEAIYRTKSGADLIKQLNATKPWLIGSLIHKFEGKEEGDIKGYLAELTRSIPSDFKAKGNLFVFVDECHRTQSGLLHDSMKELLPNAIFVGFTGTPLLKADKKTSIETFGGYIHSYKYDEAVVDEVVLDLRYEARNINQYIGSPQKIDQWFESKTRGLTPLALAQLKQKWGTMQKVLSSRSRLDQIVNDVLLDFSMKDRLMSGRGNALLVAGSIYEACKFYELFQRAGFDKCAIITSYKPSPSDISKEETGEGDTEMIEQYEIYQEMLANWFNEPAATAINKVEKFEKEVKKKFIEEPGQMKLLIVVDKLLTGFDAPSATYLYIDKQMRDHGLFQAICRVNRLDGEDKDYGYIIDYKDLFKSLEQSVQDYTSEAFDQYDKSDVDGLLKDRIEKGKERLEIALEAIRALCEPVAAPRETIDFIHYFCGQDTLNPDLLKENEQKRLSLYKLTASLLRAYANIVGELQGQGFSEAEIETVRREVDFYTKLRDEIKQASGDYIDLKSYEPAMRYLIDTYIRAEDSEKVSAFDNLTLIQLIVQRGVEALDCLSDGIANSPNAVAETIENNLRRVIVNENPVNPHYYEKMSQLLDNLIQERREEALKYEQYLERIVELTKLVVEPSSNSRYPKTINSRARQALFDNLNNDEALALAIDEVVRLNKKDNWRGNQQKEREIQRAIFSIVKDEALTNQVFEIVRKQDEYR